MAHGSIRVQTQDLRDAAAEIRDKSASIMDTLQQINALLDNLGSSWLSDSSRITHERYHATHTELLKLPEWADKAVMTLNKNAETYETTEAAQEARASGLGGAGGASGS